MLTFPALHVVLAICILLRFAETLTYSLAALLFAIYACAQSVALSNGLAINCGCFGYAQTTISWRSAVVPLILSLLSAVLGIVSARVIKQVSATNANYESRFPLKPVASGGTVPRSGGIRLELVLGLSILTLILQLFPSLWFALLWMVDVRNWSRSTWILFNAGLVVMLLGVRLGPGLYQEWSDRKSLISAGREKRAKRDELNEQRKLFARLRKARKRRSY